MPKLDTSMASINSLLNHGPAPADQRRSSFSSASHESPPTEQQISSYPATTYEAAAALTALATSGAPDLQYVPVFSRGLPSPTAFSHPLPRARRTSSFGSYIAPVEPSPPIEQAQSHSPTLHQYHHDPRSPEEHRRRSSLINVPSPEVVLAPIHNHSGATLDEPQHASGIYGTTVSFEGHSQTKYGTDVSQSVQDGEPGLDRTQNREPAFVRDEPTTKQIRKAESAGQTPLHLSTDAALKQEQTEPSPLPVIKDEPSGTPSGIAPERRNSLSCLSTEKRPSITTNGVDQETLKTIEALKQNDLGLRTKKSVTATESTVEAKPAPAPSKKRPAPGASAIKKKGTAALKKPAPKRRKLDATESESKARSGTPTSRAKPKSGRKGSTPAGSSPAPEYARSSPAHASDDEEEQGSSDDTALYCICRKPDNHRWMIGCDGGCDDWFHGSCVDMVQSDEDLVDKFICPNCEAAGRGETTWKPMCRREGCRKPARLTKGQESKYCSDECGVKFFQEQLERTAGAGKKVSGTKKAKKKGAKDGETQSRASDGEDEEPIPLGGVIRAKDLKALVVASKDVEAFKRLGSGVLSPPHTASPPQAGFDGDAENEDILFTPSEREHLNALRREKDQLKLKLDVMKDREKFVSMAREQASRLAEREKIKVKEFCGYDARLSWSDPEFARWRSSRVGRAAFKFNTLAPSDEQLASVEEEDANGDRKDVVCLRKRCAKHPQWQKLNLQDARFEELEVVEAIRECEKSEKAVRERGRRRARKDDMEKELRGAQG
ncbi:uncharacterized protein EI97DRAFT_401575, partial [Westerdykella ornata]